MSRNYEILRETEKGRNLFVPPPPPLSPHNGNGHQRQADLRGIAREEIAKLAQRIFLQSGGETPRLVVFSGVDGACGCSSICVQSAEALASQVGSPVCLIDGNLRTPSLHQFFGLGQDEGLTDAVFQAGPALRFAHRLNGGNLFLLTAGSPGAENHFFMNSERLQARLTELRAEFEFLLIDAPPLNAFADAQAFGRIADGLVLVVEANATRRESARKAKESLEAAHVKLLGVALNKRTFPIPERFYQKF